MESHLLEVLRRVVRFLQREGVPFVVVGMLWFSNMPIGWTGN